SDGPCGRLTSFAGLSPLRREPGISKFQNPFPTKGGGGAFAPRHSMDIRLARRMQGVSGNVIREILKLTQQSDIISFAGGLPSADSFPRAELQRISAEILQEVAPLQY